MRDCRHQLPRAANSEAAADHRLAAPTKAKREPANEYDALAIIIFDEKGHHLGYVSRAENEALARLKDAGKLLFGRLESKEWQGNWLKADIRIFLRDF